ncbi:MAG: rod shape-determining protein MreC [Patescibacteria group bacterium]|nr:rod shape-determining protein MreC [Patescibacteria group bacterium]
MLSKRQKILLIVLIISLLFLLNKFGGKEIRNNFYLISSPLQKFFWQIGKELSEISKIFFEIKNLKKENEKLLKENLKKEKELILLKTLEEENKFLKKALDQKLEKKFQLIMAEVISKDSEGDFILINKGKKEGVFKNMPVITEEQVLLGKIGEVFDNFSKVRLISDKDFTFDIEISTEKEMVLGIAKGKGNLKIEFQLIPREAQIKEGDIVGTSNFGGNFPKNLLIGEIKTFKKSDVEPFQEGEIEPYFTKINLMRLFVITGYKQDN